MEKKVIDISPIRFSDDELWLLDQTKLPGEEVYIKTETKEDMWDDNLAEGYVVNCNYTE